MYGAQKDALIRLKILLPGVVLLVIAGGILRAEPVISFNGPAGMAPLGNVAYGGGTTQLTGTGIAIGDMVVSGAGAADGTYVINGSIDCTQPVNDYSANDTCGSLNFTTGAGDQAGTVPGALNLFAGGGSFTITGTVLKLGTDAAINTDSTTILSGTFGFAEAQSFLEGGLGSVTKDAELLAFLGITGPGSNLADVTLDLPAPPDPTAAFSESVTSSHIENIAVPEPAAIFLLGTVMLVCAALARRRVRR